MSIANILKPYAFVNNTETADAVKVNADFDVVYAGANQAINAINSAAGGQATLAARLAVGINDDGTFKAEAIPSGTKDFQTSRTLMVAGDALATDSILYVDTAAGDVDVQLPATTGSTLRLTVVNIGLTGYAVNILPDAGETVGLLESFVLSVGGESVELAPRLGNWWRIG